MQVQHWVKHVMVCCLAVVFLLTACITPADQKDSPFSSPSAEKKNVFFEEVECSSLAPSIPADDETRCGYLSVPQRHENAEQNIKWLRLGVVIYKSRSEPAQPDPLFIAQGGPGGSTIETYAPVLINSPIRNRRDIVLFDQRGTLHSDPALMCPELSLESLNALQQSLSKEERNNLSLQAVKACYDRLTAQGIDLSSFNSRENAADIEALRQALGYQRINLYGVSYGTLLALHTMRYFPTSLRSVILDAVAPPHTNFIAELPRSAHNAFEKLFASCQAEEACRQAYPDLEKVFSETVQSLNKLPTFIQLTHPKTQQKVQFVLDGDTFQNTLFRLLYVSPFLPALPKLIHDVAAGDYDLFNSFLSLLIFDDKTSLGMFFSVVCAEYDHFAASDPLLLQSSIARQKMLEAENLEKVCGLWRVKQVSTGGNKPVISDIPTLMLSGAFDPITPETFALSAAQTLSRSYSFTFPNVGHGAMLSGKCQDQIIEEFLQNPFTPPQASCLSMLNPPQFYTSSTVIHLPIFIRLFNLQTFAWLQVVFYWLCLLVMLSATAIFISPRLLPLWIEGKHQHSLKALVRGIREDSLLAAQSLAAVNGVLALIFTMIFVALIVFFIATNDVRLYYGLPAVYKPLFIVPLINLLISMIGIILVGRAWLMSRWSKPLRIYYAVLNGAAIMLITIWHSWGILGVWLI